VTTLYLTRRRGPPQRVCPCRGPPRRMPVRGCRGSRRASRTVGTRMQPGCGSRWAWRVCGVLGASTDESKPQCATLASSEPDATMDDTRDGGRTHGTRGGHRLVAAASAQWIRRPRPRPHGARFVYIRARRRPCKSAFSAHVHGSVRTRGEATHGHSPRSMGIGEMNGDGVQPSRTLTHRRYSANRSSASAHLNSTKCNLCTHRPQTQEADPHTKRDARSRGATWRAHTCGSYT
jgi:hypothetical protein